MVLVIIPKCQSDTHCTSVYVCVRVREQCVSVFESDASAAAAAAE